MYRVFEGAISAEGKKIGIVAARFNELITGKLLEGAVNELMRHGHDEENMDIVWVPGSFEIPLAAKKMAQTGHYDGLVCLGAVIRGETSHFEYVSSEVASGLSKIALDYSLPVAFGVLTTDNLEQALSRAGGKSGNKGRDAALSVLEMCNLLNKIIE